MKRTDGRTDGRTDSRTLEYHNTSRLKTGVKKMDNQKQDNTIIERKGTKGQTMIYQNLHRKLQFEQQQHH